MSVAQAFSHFDASTMIDNALARVRRSAGIRALAPTTSVRDFLESQGMSALTSGNGPVAPASAANDSIGHGPYQGSVVGRRQARRARRALRNLAA